jgi:LytS/YehU family sensor histidine kinase
MRPSWTGLALVAFGVYLPLDLLAYLAIISLAYASDMERHSREADQREASMRAEVSATRLAAVRARLNPHFLFNALNAVHVLASAGKTVETVRVVEGLTGLLRYVLDDRRDNVPLRDELSFVRQYLEVQRLRFEGKISFSVRCQPAAESALVPQLLLQPIVENAVEHGIAGSFGAGIVQVSAAREGESLVLTVEDDGGGFVPSGGANGIGLSSTKERLARIFGHRATVSIERPEKGVRIIMSIPYTTGSQAA